MRYYALSESLRSTIEQADDLMLNEIIHAAIQRHREICPEWEVFLFLLTKTDPEDRKKQLNEIFDFMMRHHM